MVPVDRDLMLRVQAGEHSLFAELVDRFRPRLLRFAASKVGDRQLAEDIVQETFLAVFVSRDSYNPAFAFSTWIWTILLNLCRKSAVKRARLLPGVSVPRSSSSPCQALEDREELTRWLEQLPEPQADALRLRFFGALTFDEIADAMESSVIGAKVRVRKGLERLAEMARLSDNSASTRIVTPGGDCNEL
jgi:RNA polymerase sigma-70 factor (ECF subfamily)